MVLKVTKGGIRSGNSFKARNCRYIRQYSRHSIIFRRNIHPGLHQLELGDFTSDYGINTPLLPYSLNKKARWNLPDEIKHDILHGDHSDDDFETRCIELLKVNKSSQCTDICSTIYDVDQNVMEEPRSKQPRRGYLRTNNMFRDKPFNSRRRRRKGHPYLEAEQPEAYRKEYVVLRPNSISSSMTHNKKFNLYEKKDPWILSGYRRRGRNSARQYRSEKEKFVDITGQLADGHDDLLQDQDETPFDQVDFQDDMSDESVERNDTYEVELEEMVGRSAILKQSKRIKVKTTKANKAHGKSGAYDSRKRHHIVYDNQNMPNNTDSQTASLENKSDKSKSIAKDKSNMHTRKQELCVVKLSPDNVSKVSLRRKFGDMYIECKCYPRKFVIDLSEMMADTMGCNRKSSRIIACLTFSLDDSYDFCETNAFVFKVCLDSNILTTNQHAETMPDTGDVMKTSFDQVVRDSVQFFTTLQDTNRPSTEVHLSARHAKEGRSNHEHLAGWSCSSYKPDDTFLFQNVMISTVRNHGEDLPRPSEENANVTDGEFCGICYFPAEDMVSKTALQQCGHWFCDHCWETYLENLVTSGADTLICPEYECDSVIDLGTLVSLVRFHVVMQYAHTAHEIQLMKQQVSKWCPNKQCGRVLCVKSLAVATARCSCGQVLCFQCLGDSHWPAPCEIMKEYHKKLKESGDLYLTPFDDHTEVLGKHCPNCGRFVEKYGGCPYMTCVCRQNFCWGCGQKYPGHTQGPWCEDGFKDDHGTFAMSVHSTNIRKGKGRRRWYKVALIHRFKQHALKSQKRSSFEPVIKQIKQFIVGSERRSQPTKLPLNEPDNDVPYAHEADKAPVFVKQMVDLELEMHNIVEHLAVLLNYRQLDKQTTFAVQFVLYRLSTLASLLHTVLMNGAANHSGNLVKELVDLRKRSVMTIRGVVKCMGTVQDG